MMVNRYWGYGKLEVVDPTISVGEKAVRGLIELLEKAVGGKVGNKVVWEVESREGVRQYIGLSDGMVYVGLYVRECNPHAPSTPDWKR